jgi:flagella basal body P-ring formation protein FlgA
LLIEDLAARLNLAPESLQVSFKAQDENLLNLPLAQFTFDVEPIRARNLGEVSWNVSIFSGDDRKRVSISATARAWQTEVVAARNLSFRQIVSPQDVVERRTLADRLPEDTLLRVDQVIGQQAARELKPGTVLTARLIDPVQLVKVGQFVTVTLKQGSVSVTTVVRALENGVYGQTIRVRNEATRDVDNITVTGAQAGEMVTHAVASTPRD